MKQLDAATIPGKKVLAAINIDVLSSSDKEKLMDAINIIKMKICGTIKGRRFENGSQQRQYLREEENIVSPTLYIGALFTILVIVAYKERD